MIGALARTSAPTAGLFLAAGLAFSFLTCLVPMLFFFVSVAGFVLSRRSGDRRPCSTSSPQIVPVYKDELHEALRRDHPAAAASRASSAPRCCSSSPASSSPRSGSSSTTSSASAGGPGLPPRACCKDSSCSWPWACSSSAASSSSTSSAGSGILLLPARGRCPSEWIRSLFLALAVGFSTVLFFVMYRYFPHRGCRRARRSRARSSPRCCGRRPSRLFRWYILSVGVYDQIYGPLGRPGGAGHVRLLLRHRLHPGRGVHGRLLMRTAAAADLW